MMHIRGQLQAGHERRLRGAVPYRLLTDAEWPLVEPPVPPPDHRPPWGPGAIRHMPATGCRWRAVPGCCPPFTTVRDHFHPWRGNGVSGRVTDAPRGLAHDPAGRSPGPAVARTDSQPARTVETAGSDTTRAGGRGPQAERRGQRRGNPGHGPGAQSRRSVPGRRIAMGRLMPIASVLAQTVPPPFGHGWALSEAHASPPATVRTATIAAASAIGLLMGFPFICTLAVRCKRGCPPASPCPAPTISGSW